MCVCECVSVCVSVIVCVCVRERGDSVSVFSNVLKSFPRFSKGLKRL